MNTQPRLPGPARTESARRDHMRRQGWHSAVRECSIIVLGNVLRLFVRSDFLLASIKLGQSASRVAVSFRELVTVVRPLLTELHNFASLLGQSVVDLFAQLSRCSRPTATGGDRNPPDPDPQGEEGHGEGDPSDD